MTRKVILSLLSLLVLGLTGCWDQSLLKDSNLITCVGIDQNEKGKVELTATTNIGIPEVGVAHSTQGKGGLIVTALGNTVREARIMIDRKTTKSLNASELQIVLVSDSFARKNFISPLNVFFRDRLSNLHAKIIIVEGSPSHLMRTISKDNPQVGRYLADMLRGQEKRFIVPAVNLGSIIGDILPPGKDALIPVMKVQADEAQMHGTAMIHDEKMKGILTADETVTALSFTPSEPNEAMITLKVEQGLFPPIRNYMTIAVVGKKRNLHVHIDRNNKIIAQLDAVLTAHIQEFDKYDTYSEANIQKWNRELSEQLTKKAKDTVDKLQKNQCDLYGIGERIRAFHPKLWSSLDWETAYGEVEFQVQVKVQIQHTGGVN
ncbi:Ger(x)C family spore germination protein [Paenibacillus albus]|uniref:Ger(x)C family spore germination protein n=1 Tax=Paenibacillus albus TaxID=2495582 RepID=UPI0013E00732|nr:Ger(x)C family spore germination protein [Paenibacillus albus]